MPIYNRRKISTETKKVLNDLLWLIDDGIVYYHDRDGIDEHKKGATEALKHLTKRIKDIYFRKKWVRFWTMKSIEDSLNDVIDAEIIDDNEYQEYETLIQWENELWIKKPKD